MPAGWVSAGIAAVGLANSMGAFGGGGGGGGGGSTGSGGSTTVSPTYDPYGPYRAQAATDLSNLMNQPQLAMTQPGYQQQLKQGMQTLNRGMAATGQLASGQEMASLDTLGQNTFGSYYNSMLANLMQLSGASESPAAAGQAQTQANLARSSIGQQNLVNLTSGLGGLVGGVSKGISGWGNSGGWDASVSGGNVGDTSYGNIGASSVMSNPWDPSTL